MPMIGDEDEQVEDEMKEISDNDFRSKRFWNRT